MIQLVKVAKINYLRLTRLLCLIATSGFFIATSQAYDTPDIFKIRANYDFINSQIDSRAYTRSVKELPYCQGRIDQTREIWLDKNGAPRRYSQSGGTDDSFISIDYYFDFKKRLNFVLIQHNDIHGLSASLRVYYDESGKIIRSTQSPGNTSEDYWQAISSEPLELFNAPYTCER